MDAKAYLGQVRTYQNNIKRRREHIEELKCNCYGIGSVTGDADRVQTSPSINGQYGMIDTLLDEERKLNQEITDFQLFVSEIDRSLDHISNQNFQNAVRDKWVRSKSWEQIAVDRGYSYDRVRYFYWQGMREVNRLIKGGIINTEKTQTFA